MKKYKYQIMETMDTFINVIDYSINNIVLCPYMIYNKCKYPFIQYMLIQQNNILNFHSIDTYINNTHMNNITSSEKKTELYNKIIHNYMLIIYKNNIQSIKQILQTLNIKIRELFSFKCCYQYNNILYLFCDISLLQDISVDLLYKLQNNQLYFATIHELYNTGYIYNLHIAPHIQKLFTHNNKLNVLLDNNDNIIEHPIVGYKNIHKNMTLYNMFFGNSNTNNINNSELFNMYYTFYIYSDTQLLKQPDECIIRYVLFMENMFMCYNCSYTYIQNKINHYNSIYLGRKNNQDPHYIMYIVKKLNQQHLMDIHEK